MRIIHYILYSCIVILLVSIFIKNYNNSSNIKNGKFSHRDLISFSNNEVKSIASFNFSTSFIELAEIFEIPVDNIRNNILKKTIKVRANDAEIIIFVGENAINQITININNDIDVLLNNLLKNMQANSLEIKKEIIEDENGNKLVEIYTHIDNIYKFIITKTTTNLTIDYINNIIN